MGDPACLYLPTLPRRIADQPWVQVQLIFPVDDVSQYQFPEDDLMKSLIDLYFAHVNPMWPLLHRPTLEGYIINNMHRTDIGIGSNVLLICAIASRYSDDPRVLLDTGRVQSAGWRWYKQVAGFRCSLMGEPTLHDLQFFCVCVVEDFLV
jgi:hypothetical protein